MKKNLQLTFLRLTANRKSYGSNKNTLRSSAFVHCKLTQAVFFLSLLLLSFTLPAQTNGDYRSIASGNWSTLSTWQRYNGLAWSTPTTAQGYPGRYSTGLVTIQTGHTITLNVSPVSSINAVLINADGADTKLTVSGMNVLSVTNAITLDPPNTNNVSATLDVAAGSITCSSLNSTNSTNDLRDCKVSISTGNLTVTGNIAMGNNVTRNDITFTGAGLLKVGGSFTTGAFNAATGCTVEYNGANQTIAPYHYYHLTTNGSGSKTVQATQLIDGNLSIGLNTTFDFGSSTHTVTVSGDLDGEGTLKMNGNGLAHTLNLGGANNLIPLLLTTTGSNSTINYIRNGNQQVFESANYQNVTTSGSGLKTISEDITINAALTVNANTTLDFDTTEERLITVNGNLSGIGSIRMSGTGLAHVLQLNGESNSIGTLQTTNASGSTIMYMSSTNQQIIASTNYQNLTIAGSATKTLQGITTIQGNLFVSSGTLELLDENLTVLGSTTVSGTLNDGNTFGSGLFTGKFIVYSGGVVSVSNSAVPVITFTGGIQNEGSFNLPGTVTFNGANQVIEGSSAILVGGNVAITGGITVENQNSGLVLGNLTVHAGNKLVNSYASFPTTYDEFTSGAVATAKFNSLVASNHAGNSLATTATALVLTRATNNASSAVYATRTTDLSPAAKAVVVKFTLSVANATAQTDAATILLGNGFVSNTTRHDPVTARLRINLSNNSSTSYSLTHPDGTATTSATYTSSQAITWAINTSQGTITYSAPNSTQATLASGKADVWVGTTRFATGLSVQNPSLLMSDLKVLMDKGTATITISNLTIMPWIQTSALACTALYATPFSGAKASVNYAVAHSFNTDNVFTAQLSDATGSFASPVTIGTISSTASSGTIDATIPTTTTGSGYRIRVISSSPSLDGSDIGSNLSIGQYIISPYSLQSFSTTGNGTLLTASGSGATSYQWGYYRAAGNAITPLSGRTTATYTPQASDFPGAGSYSLVCLMATSGASCTATSNEVLLYINCPQTASNPNLVVNGDFSNGNASFTSDYFYATTAGCLSTNTDGIGTSTGGEGKYAIGTNPNYFHSAFCTMPASSPSSPISGGKMLIANADANSSKTVWKQTIAVTANTDYVLTFYAASLAGSANSLLFGTYVGCFRTGVDVSVPYEVNNCTWNKYTFQFNSGNKTSMDISIRNISAAASGNDIALDDIQFYACQQVSSPPFPLTNAFTWQGITTDWFNPDNWSNSCSLPTCTDNVVIPVLGASKKYPVINASGAASGSVTIDKGASLSITAGYNLSVCGSFINHGSFLSGSTATLTFTNDQSSVISSDTSPFSHIIVNKTNATDILQLSSDLTIAGNLTITKGNVNANGKSIQIGGNFSNAGTFAPAGSTVEFNGSTAQQFSQTGTGDFYKLIINNASASNLITFNPAVTTVAKQLTLLRGITVTTGTNEIWVTDAAESSVSGYSANSYVYGKLRRSISDKKDYEFPVGDGTRYELIEVNITKPLNGTSNILAFFTSNAPSGSAPSLLEENVTYTQLCSGGYWTLTPDAQPTNGRFDLQVSPVGFSCILPNQTILKRPNSSGTWGSAGGKKNKSNRREDFTSFSEVALVSGTQVSLPVRLLEFSGQPMNGQTNLSWITISEQNNAYFQIERSGDGSSFEPIGKIGGNGTSRAMHTYAFVDETPLSGMNYYRLKQVDINGEFEYSKTIGVRVITFAKVTVYPNPILQGQTGHLRLSTKEAANYQVSISDQAGRLLLQTKLALLSGENEVALPGSEQLPAGLYLIHLSRLDLTDQHPIQSKLLIK